ncbi:hypothetical protein D1007_37314 [Hordeum vulgare]|nr:hypothetical protein D1007_37314 [Hordeum vulgare]
MEDEYPEEPRSRARFDYTDDEEREENIASLVLQEYDGEHMPTIEWNRDNPQLTPGTVFKPMVECRNEVTTYCILSENSYEVDRSEPGRFTVHCPYDRCRWRLHASTMLKSKLIQIKTTHTGTLAHLDGEGERTDQSLQILVDASFGQEEQWAAANAEENAAAEENAISLGENAAAQENAASLEENEATKVAACSRIIRGTRQKRPSEEENSVEPSSNAEFEIIAYEGFMFSFQIENKCTHFEWLDDYVKRIQFNGALWGLNLSSAQTNLVSKSAALTVGDADVKGN